MDLPKEILGMVFDLLDPLEIISMTLVSRELYQVSLRYRFRELSWNLCPKSGFRLLTQPPPELPFAHFTRDLHLFHCFRKNPKKRWSYKQLCPCKPDSDPNQYISTDEFSGIIDSSRVLRGVHLHTYDLRAYSFLLDRLRASKPLKSLTMNLSTEIFEIPDSQTVLKQARNLEELSVAFPWKDANDNCIAVFSTIWELIALNRETLKSLNLGCYESMSDDRTVHNWQSSSLEQWSNNRQELRLNELRIFRSVEVAYELKVIQFFAPETLTTFSLVDAPGFDDTLMKLAKEKRLPNLKALELCRSISRVSKICRIVGRLPPLEILSLTSWRYQYNVEPGDWFAFRYLNRHKDSLRVLWLDVWPDAFTDLSSNSDVDKPSMWRRLYKPDPDNPFDFSDYPQLRELALPETLDELTEVIPAPQLQRLRSLQHRSSTKSRTINYDKPFKNTCASIFKIIGDRQIAQKRREACQAPPQPDAPTGSSIAPSIPIFPSLDVLIDGEMALEQADAHMDVPKICRAEYKHLKPNNINERDKMEPSDYKTSLKVVSVRQFWRHWPGSCLFGHARGPWAWIGRPFPNGRHTGRDWIF
ncbi:hypothetical protein TWF970_007062 [Orbilia oligospora]|uniref:F-box domain-containing protein n=1 Tax=Orbilia oligospora TaxID=2813651 RepID=A0A7C8RLY1_ORBOL|nr:hypothetical protein TWF970_007062 [Orbilia oligospora]